MKLDSDTAAQLIAQADADADALIAEACRRSLSFFTEVFWPVLEPGRPLVHGWVLDAIDEHLQAVTMGEIQRLLITVPPGSMKSLKTRVFWPCWEWALNPRHRYIAFSYAEALAMRDNRRARLIVEDPLYMRLFPDVRLSVDQAAKGNFENISHGFMMANGVGGRTTGYRGDRVVIDDPHNVREGESEKIRTSTVQWFNEAVPSRVNDLARDAFVVIQQRVHYEDVAQAAIDQGYEHLNVPAHFDEDRPCRTSIGWQDPRTYDGENFWPERYPDQELDRLAEALGPYAFAAQYEQSPTPREGGLFKVGNLRTIEDIPDEKIVWADGWDLAGSDEKENRDSAFTVRVRLGWVERTGRFVISYVDRRRLSPGKVEQWLDEVADATPKSVTLVLPQDPGQAGKAQKARLSQILAGVNFRFELQSGDKETRASPFAAQVENGNVDLVRGPWNKDFVEELRQFPRGKFKDQVDAAASAFNHVAPRRSRRKALGAVSSTVANRARAT